MLNPRQWCASYTLELARLGDENMKKGKGDSDNLVRIVHIISNYSLCMVWYYYTIVVAETTNIINVCTNVPDLLNE